MRRFPILLLALFALSFTVQAEVKDVYDFDTGLRNSAFRI